MHARFRVLRTADWTEVAVLGEADGTDGAVHVSEGAFLPDSSALVVCDEGGTVRMLDVATGTSRVVAERPSEAGTYDCAVSPRRDPTRADLRQPDRRPTP